MTRCGKTLYDKRTGQNMSVKNCEIRPVCEPDATGVARLRIETTKRIKGMFELLTTYNTSAENFYQKDPARDAYFSDEELLSESEFILH